MKQRFRYINAQDAQDRLQNWRVQQERAQCSTVHV